MSSQQFIRQAADPAGTAHLPLAVAALDAIDSGDRAALTRTDESPTVQLRPRTDVPGRCPR